MGFEEGMNIIWDAVKGNKVHQIEAHKGPVTNINFTEDRMLMVSCGKDMTAKLWTMDDEYECVQTYETDRPLNDAAISPFVQPGEGSEVPHLDGWWPGCEGRHDV